VTSVWAIVPARAGSKGLPDKNILCLSGHPLIGWSVRAGVLSQRIERVIVSTDSERYAEIARSYGAETPFLRPVEFATDLSPDLGFMQHAISWFLKNEGVAPDLWVHLRPTTPMRKVALIDEAVDVAIADAEATALRSVHLMPESAYKAFEVREGRLSQVGSGSTALDAANNARQAFPATYYANGYVDVVRTSLIRERGIMHGDRVRAFVTSLTEEVDCPEDFDYLEFLSTKRPEIAAALFVGSNGCV
jgi:N-acylneuraminate cytidylyltransferase